MMQLHFHPFPELETERLLLRKLTQQDAAAIFFLRSDKKVMEFIDREPAVSIREAEEFIDTINFNSDNGNSILWGIAFKEHPSELIGTICYWQIQPQHYRSEIGYMLHPHHWRKGIMKEALLKVIDYGFQTMKLHSIEARINAANTASTAILLSTGFRQEAYFKEDCFFRGKFMDTIVYSLIRENP